MVFKESGKLPVTLMLLPLKINISNKLRDRRTLLELLETFKQLEDLFTIDQKLICTDLNSLKLSQRKLLPRPKHQMRAERSSRHTSKKPQLLLKLKTLLKTREPLKLPKWTPKTSRTLSMRAPESDPEELP